MSSYRSTQPRGEALPGNSMHDVDQAIYSGGQPAGDLADPRMIANPTPIDRIWADVKQPRRAVPASIRMHWNGNPEDVAGLLEQWHTIATSRAGVEINIVEVLMGRGEGVEVENAPAIFTSYLDLLRLAQSIYREGLVNPIWVIDQPAAGRALIETGERRWLAFWLLHLNMGETRWSKIPAIRSDGRDYVWRQAQENTARRQLNAIGMARQLALLIMDSRKALDGVQYDEYETLVSAGGCDRRYYAQIANGNLHMVPRGLGERIQASMGLSKHQLSQYRRLLQLTDEDQVNDALWVRADVEDWPEKALREIADRLTGVNLRDAVLGSDDWTLDDLRKLAVPPVPPVVSPGYPYNEDPMVHYETNDRVLTPENKLGVVIAANRDRVTVKQDGERLARTFYAVDLALVDRKQALEPAPLPPQLVIRYERGEAVENKHTGEIGKVISSYRAKDGLWVVVDFEGVPINKRDDEVMQLGMTYEEYLQQELESDPGVTFDHPETDLPEEEAPPQPPPASKVLGMPPQPTVPVRLSEYYDRQASALTTSNPWQIGDRVYVEGIPSPGTIRYIKGDKCGVFSDHSHTTHYYDWRILTSADQPKVSEERADKADSPARDPNAPIIPRDDPRRTLLQYWQGIAVMLGDDPTQLTIQAILTMTPEEAHTLAETGALDKTMNDRYDQVWQALVGWMEGPFAELLELITQVGNER